MDLQRYAEQWIDDWNSHDIDRILAHYRTDVLFHSPNALTRVGKGVVEGIEALRAYWGPALVDRPGLRFTLKRAFLGHLSLSIHYGDELGRDVVETLIFDDAGKVIYGTGCYA
jgi:hypothetical protein